MPAGFSLFHLGKSRPIPFVTNISLVITGMVNCLTIKLLITNFIEIIFFANRADLLMTQLFSGYIVSIDIDGFDSML